MNTEQILMCVVALILGMLLANMLKSVCGCKVVEGQSSAGTDAQPLPTAPNPCQGLQDTPGRCASLRELSAGCVDEGVNDAWCSGNCAVEEAMGRSHRQNKCDQCCRATPGV